VTTVVGHSERRVPGNNVGPDSREAAEGCGSQAWRTLFAVETSTKKLPVGCGPRLQRRQRQVVHQTAIECGE
jgi:hypothetical protein